MCHTNAECTLVSPEVCVTERPIIYRCVCKQGYTGDGTDCTGEPIESAGRHLCYAKMVNTLLSIDAILVIHSDYIGLGLYSQKYDANRWFHRLKLPFHRQMLSLHHLAIFGQLTFEKIITYMAL